MTDGTYTAVQFGALEAGEADLMRAYSNFTETVNTLLSQLRSNLSSWSGGAQAAYETVQTNWNKAQADMANVMAALGKTVGVANTNYMSTEATNAKMWGGN